jgi:DNA processing protein
MAVPGRITDSRSEGTNHLIKTNVAQLVTSAQDMAAALGWEVAGAMPEKMHFAPHEITPKERLVYNAIADSSDGLTLEKVADMVALPIAEVSAILLNMELSGLVRQLPGKVYVIC